MHNLSAMSKREAEAFLAQARERRTCLTYVMRRDGSLVTRSTWDEWRWRWRRLNRGLLAAARPYVLHRHLSRASLRAGEPRETV